MATATDDERATPEREQALLRRAIAVTKDPETWEPITMERFAELHFRCNRRTLHRYLQDPQETGFRRIPILRMEIIHRLIAESEDTPQRRREKRARKARR